ncbi:MAG: Flp pilus assembly complex ATPase component TadA, partial [Phycisphaerales bacterium]
TLHTNDAPGAVVRLSDMGMEHFLIASALNGVIAQRLARTICKSCRARYFPPKHLLQQVGWVGPAHETLNLYHGEGCRQCHDSGHRGRIGIYEIMEMDVTLREMVHNHCDEGELRAHLQARGFMTLREEGLICVQKGITTLEEILRVTHAEDSEAEEDRGRKWVRQSGTPQSPPRQGEPHDEADQPVGAAASHT